MAAEQGHMYAQNNLAMLYESGKGAKKNYKEARTWYLYAAEQGHAPSQYALGQIYEKGRGVTKDKEKAYYWYFIATVNATDDNREGYSAERDRIKKSLSTKQLEKIENEASVWMWEQGLWLGF